MRGVELLLVRVDFRIIEWYSVVRSYAVVRQVLFTGPAEHFLGYHSGISTHK